MTLKLLREEKSVTQRRCADYLGIPLRTYQLYESDPSRQGTMKYNYMLDKLKQYGYVDETHGLLTLEQIKERCAPIFKAYGVTLCYLFGSYAKRTATETSDIDLLLSTPLRGMKFYEFVEALRETLKKKLDVLTVEQLSHNTPLLTDILKEGIKIYG